MNYLQDCSIFQSEDVGLGFAHVQETKKSWLLSAWNVEVVRRPDVTEEITIATWPYDFKGIYGLRNFAILDKAGNYLVKADSCWFLTDITTGRPVRLTPEETSLYPVVEPRLDMEDLPRKIALPDEMKEYVKRMDCVLGVQATAPYNCGVLSLEENLYINFIRNTCEPELEAHFFRVLQEMDLPAEVQSNNEER